MAVKRFLLLALVFSIMVTTAPVLADGDFYVIAGGGGVGTPITSLPYPINQSGFYYLKGNLTAASGTGITVGVDNVTIDLMGFCLSGNSGNDGIYMNGRKNVEIRNGILRGWRYGIFESSTSNGWCHRVINVRALSNTSGIYLNSHGNLVKGCTAVDNTDVGIYAFDSTISDNMVWVTASGNTGINGSGIIRCNTVRGCGSGIQVSYDTNMTSVIGNSVHTFPSQVGIDLYSIGPIIMDQNAVGGNGTHYSGTGGSNVVWAGKSSTYLYGNNAGTP